MVIDIQRISERGLHLSGVLEIDQENLIEESAYLAAPVDYDIRFVRDKEKIKVSGKMSTKVVLSCVRCLEEFELPIDGHFDLVLFPVGALTQAEHSIKEEESEYIFYKGNKIDLAKILSEQVNLSLPFNPVCHEDCKGLCSYCGANLNEGDCHCGHSGSEISLLFDKIKR